MLVRPSDRWYTFDMAEIILLHSAQGLRPGVGAAAEALREGGHMVRTPDYYDGEVFDELEAGLRVQVHHAERDPWVDESVVAGLGAAVGAGFECFAYPGDAHLFADPGLPGYSGESAALMWKRVRDFLSRI
jgi:dienelactone hydrolase